MTDIELSSGSPFERIKRTRPDGTEYWLGRELQPLMGYARWDSFMTPLNRAMRTATNTGMDASRNFRGSPKISATKPGDDYELSREAAYLVAMNGDPNKPEVAAAQVYFARQTNAAEVMQADLEAMPAEIQREIAVLLRQGRLENEQRQQRARLDVHDQELEQLTTELQRTRQELENARRRIEAVENDEGWPTARSYAIRNKHLTDSKYLSAVSRRARSVAREHDIEPIPVPSVQWGTTNSYPDWIWAAAFALVNPDKYQGAAA